MRTQLRKRKSI